MERMSTGSFYSARRPLRSGKESANRVEHDWNEARLYETESLLDQVSPLDMSVLSDRQLLERHTSTLRRPAAIWHGSGLMWMVDPSGLLVMWAARARVPDCRKGFFIHVEASHLDRKESGWHSERSFYTA